MAEHETKQVEITASQCLPPTLMISSPHKKYRCSPSCVSCRILTCMKDKQMGGSKYVHPDILSTRVVAVLANNDCLWAGIC